MVARAVAAAATLVFWLPTPALASDVGVAEALGALAPVHAEQAADDFDPAPWSGSTGHLLALILLHTYRNTLARTDLDACAFTPSCSRYAQLAIDERGWIRGILSGADRLLRDHPGVPHLGYAPSPDGKHFRDPVETPCEDCE